MLAIICAMREEIQTLKSRLQHCKQLSVNGVPYTRGNIHGKEIIVCECGIGKVNAAIATVSLCSLAEVTTVINCGVAGGLGDKAEPGDTVIADSCVYHDYDLGADDGYEYAVYRCSDKINTEFIKIVEEAGLRYRKGVIATGDQFIRSAQKAEWICKTFSAIACDMESAAIAQACKVSEKDCAIVRAISDLGNDDAKTSFEDFLERAVETNLKIIEQYIKNSK